MLSFKHFLEETTLAGKSRGTGKSKWDNYLAPVWDKKDGYIFTLAKDANILGNPENKEVLYSAKKGTMIKILSKEVVKSGTSSFAEIMVKGEAAGFVNINSIQKPTDRNDNAVIPGGKNSKEFTPDKLGLGGDEFKSSSSLVAALSKGLKKLYGDDKYSEIMRYLSDFTKQISGHALITEGKKDRFTKVYTTKEVYDIAPQDIKVLSKNFGEVLGALYIIHTNKKMSVIGFPSNISEGLYDFYGREASGVPHYYSVKSHGGSSTSLANLNFIKKHFATNNSYIQKHIKELNAIDALINYKGTHTVGNITEWFKKEQPSKVKQIISIMSKTGGVKLKSLAQSDLTTWIQAMRKNSDVETFVKTMNKVYKDVLSDQPGSTPKAAKKSLEDMFNTPTASEYSAGYLIYPLGSYIVSYMNADTDYREALNILANAGTFVSQCTVDMEKNTTTIQIIKFSKNEFKFSYNGGSKYPGNRPIGFKEA